jgi:hypothetical protein
MIGDGAGFHAEIHRSLTQILQPYRPVKQAVFSMAMKMREITHVWNLRIEKTMPKKSSPLPDGR